MVLPDELESAHDAKVSDLLEALEQVCYQKVTEYLEQGVDGLDSACKVVDLMKAVGLI